MEEQHKSISGTPEQPTAPSDGPTLEPAPTAEPIAIENKKPEPAIPQIKSGRAARLKNWLATHKKKSVLLGALIILILLGALPWSRYKIAGLALSQNVTIKVVDAATGSPVSGATVTFGAISSQTDGSGLATLKLKDGWRQVTISKSYYTSSTQDVLVPILHQRTPANASLVATGRQVKVTLTNLISGDALSGASISAAGVESKTDSSGLAVIVVPAGQDELQAKITLAGFNETIAKIRVSATEIKNNIIQLTPSGKIYYLSNKDGNVDLMSANLDGSGSKVLLAGSGNENPDNSTMSVSPDDKFIALLTSRTSDSSPQLYVIDARSGDVIEVDHGAGRFALDGWTGDRLIYHFSSTSTKTWQPGLNELVSYEASTNKSTNLDKSLATGDSGAAAQEGYDYVSVQASSKLVLFGKSWQVDYSLPGVPSLSSKKNTFNSVATDGTEKQVVSQYAAKDYLSYNQYLSDSYYISDDGGSTTSYYAYQIGGGQPKLAAISSAAFYKSYPSYFYSPDGKQTFWSEKRNGLQASFIGDGVAANAKQLGKTLTRYMALGWYDNNYVLFRSTDKQCSISIASINGHNPVDAVDNCLAPTGSYNG